MTDSPKAPTPRVAGAETGGGETVITNLRVPVVPEGAPIAQAILAHTAAMRADGSFETTSLCWDPAELELLAMFAIDAKQKLSTGFDPAEAEQK